MQKFTGRTESNLYELKLKQKTIGKLGTSYTKIDISTSFGKLLLFNDWFISLFKFEHFHDIEIIPNLQNFIFYFMIDLF